MLDSKLILVGKRRNHHILRSGSDCFLTLGLLMRRQKQQVFLNSICGNRTIVVWLRGGRDIVQVQLHNSGDMHVSIRFYYVEKRTIPQIRILFAKLSRHLRERGNGLRDAND
jgi:hypothetical protein